MIEVKLEQLLKVLSSIVVREFDKTIEFNAVQSVKAL
jgi:hypothetical protein